MGTFACRRALDDCTMKSDHAPLKYQTLKSFCKGVSCLKLLAWCFKLF